MPSYLSTMGPRLPLGLMVETSFLGIGVLQGDKLASCLLFVLVIDWIMRYAVPDASFGFCVDERVGTRSRCTSPALFVTTDLDYVDDIAILSSSVFNMQAMILSSCGRLKSVLRLTVPRLNSWYPVLWILLLPQLSSTCLASGLELKKVLDFKYLGTWLLSSVNDFKLRCTAAWSSIKRLNGIWKSTAISYHLKIRLFNCLVVSILILQCRHVDHEQDPHKGSHRRI